MSGFKFEVTEDVTALVLKDGVDAGKVLELDDENKVAYPFETDPINFTLADFRKMLVSAAMSGCHDVTLKSGDQAKAKFRGNQYNMTRRALNDGEVNNILTEVYGAANARSEINSAKPIDTSFDIMMPDGKNQRFRVNATGVYGGIEVTMRVLSRDTPTKEMVGLTDDLIEAMSPENGLVVVAGETGSGKSTTNAAVLREHLIRKIKTCKIVDFQAPIEYTFTDITADPNVASMISCSEVGRNLQSFAQGVHTALRRNPDIICVGESRDPETMRATLLASITGHLVYTTTHAGSVAEAVMRMLSEFPQNEREARANELSTSLRLVLVQRLIPREDGSGKFVAVREYLKISDRLRDKMASTPLAEWQSLFLREVNGDCDAETGPDDLRQSTRDHVTRLAQEGLITIETARLIARTSQINALRVA